MTPHLQLDDTVSIPMIGYGTWKLTGNDAVEAVRTALSVGYRHIDTADRYGNHHEIATALRESNVARDELFVTTKLWRDSLTTTAVHETTDRFLAELGLDYIDLLLIHWPNADVPIAETLGAMQECKEAGKIRAIGVSNFTEHHLDDARATGVRVVNNQVELRPRFDQASLRAYCASHDVSITAYSPLRAGDMESSLIVELAEKYERSPAQIILNWIVARGMIIIPQGSSKAHMTENFAAFEFQMDAGDLARIDSLPDAERFNDPDFHEFTY